MLVFFSERGETRRPLDTANPSNSVHYRRSVDNYSALALVVPELDQVLARVEEVERLAHPCRAAFLVLVPHFDTSAIGYLPVEPLIFPRRRNSPSRMVTG